MSKKEITALPKGMKAVVVDMDEGDYRADQSVANSDLGLLQSSPKGLSGVKAGDMEGFSSSGFAMGTALDMLMTKPEEYADTYIIEPIEMTKPTTKEEKGFCADMVAGVRASDAIINNYKTDKKTEDAIAKMAFERIEKFELYFEYEKQLAAGKIAHSQSDYEELMIMKAAIEKHEAANKVFFGEEEGYVAFSQLAIFWVMLGVICKALLDRVLINKEEKIVYLYDLKYTGKGVGFFEDSIERYRYYRQMAYYFRGLRTIFPKFTIYVRIIAVTPQWGGECRVLELEDGWYLKGQEEYTELINLYKWHQDNNKWEHRKEYYECQGVEVINYVK